MPWPQQRKQQTRDKILDSAVQLFSRRGYDNVSIGDVMESAQLTHGGFYAHFPSKQALYAEAVTSAARASALSKALPSTDAGKADLSQLLNGYLDITHVKQQQPPCPLAFLATDVANREDEVRDAYTRVFKRLVAFLSRELDGSSPQNRARARAMAAMMIGGVAVSRALNDEASVEALLNACRQFGSAMLEGAGD